jgi:signal transduction histidine kinase
MHCEGILTVSSRLSRDPGYVEIDATDTGDGMPPDVLPLIFDPFFTSRGTDGSGLGLSVSYGIIRNHKGEIEVKGEIGEGTTFIIKLTTRQWRERDEAKEDNGNSFRALLRPYGEKLMISFPNL